eukprot:30154_1
MSKDIYYNDLPSPFDPGQVMYPRCTTFSDNSADLDQQSANQPGIPRRHVYLGYVPKQSGDNMTRNASSGVSPGRSSSKDLKRVNVLPAGTHKVPKTNRDYGGRSTDSTSGFSSDRGYVPGSLHPHETFDRSKPTTYYHGEMPYKMNAHDVSQFQNNQPAGYTMVPTPHQDYYNSEHHGYLSVQDIPSQLI